jgi:hypothetical protein
MHTTRGVGTHSEGSLMHRVERCAVRDDAAEEALVVVFVVALLSSLTLVLKTVAGHIEKAVSA